MYGNGRSNSHQWNDPFSVREGSSESTAMVLLTAKLEKKAAILLGASEFRNLRPTSLVVYYVSNILTFPTVDFALTMLSESTLDSQGPKRRSGRRQFLKMTITMNLKQPVRTRHL